MSGIIIIKIKLPKHDRYCNQNNHCLFENNFHCKKCAETGGRRKKKPYVNPNAARGAAGGCRY